MWVRFPPSVLEKFVVTNNSLAVASEFSRPRLAVLPAGKTSLRLAQVKKQHTLFLSCAPSRARTCDLILKRDLLYQLSYGR